MKIHWEKRKSRVELTVFGGIGFIVLLLFFCAPVDRALESLGYECPFKSLTGQPCALCGSTRAFAAAAGLEFGRAVRWNPLGTVLFVALCLFAPMALLGGVFGYPRAHLSSLPSRVQLGAALALVIGVMVNWLYVLLRQPPG